MIVNISEEAAGCLHDEEDEAAADFENVVDWCMWWLLFWVVAWLVLFRGESLVFKEANAVLTRGFRVHNIHSLDNSLQFLLVS